MKTILFIFGTRPEVIKLAPVIQQFKVQSEYESVVCVTGQHREMLEQMLEVFDLEPDVDLEVMEEDQRLVDLTSRSMKLIDQVIASRDADMTVVQGDTTTTFTGALSSFYQQVPIAHVEAGLRTGHKYDPFPEELNRKLVDSLADLCFAPTVRNKRNLIQEGVPDSAIKVTGNTVIDALLEIERKMEAYEGADPNLPFLGEKEGDKQEDLILVTAHRRESFGEGLNNICEAILELSRKLPQGRIVYPVHLNPSVKDTVYSMLGGVDNVELIDPVPYLSFVKLMKSSKLILTDSGGIQEEAPTLGTPVLILRNSTERPEAVEAGSARLVGTNAETIVSETLRLLEDSEEYQRMVDRPNPFGDGRASERIYEEIEDYFSGAMSSAP